MDYFILHYQEDGTWELENSQEKIIGEGREELINSLPKKCNVYDNHLSLTRHYIGDDFWDAVVEDFHKGKIKRCKKGNIIFLDGSNLCDELSPENIENLRFEDGTLPKSQAEMVIKELDNLEYPDFKCWMRDEIYDVYKGLNRGPMIGCEKSILGDDLLVDTWDIKSSYPYIMYTKNFSPRYMKVCYNPSLHMLLRNELWVAEFKFKSISPKPSTIIDWLNPEIIENLEGTFTSVDWIMLTTDYDFEIETISRAITSFCPQKLPQPIREFVMDNFEVKETMPKETQEYDRAKRNVNIIYGAFYITPQEQDKKGWAMQQEKRRPCCIGYWVASYGRYALWEAMKIKPEGVVYWNTDGFMTTEDIHDEMEKLNKQRKIKGTDLGQWINEKLMVDARIFGNGQVYIDGVLKCCGLSKEDSNKFLEETNQIPYAGMVIPAKYSGRWGFINDKIQRLEYTLGGIYND